MYKDTHQTHTHASSHVKCMPVACQHQVVPTELYSRYPLLFVSGRSMDDWWPQLTDSNNCQSV